MPRPQAGTPTDVALADVDTCIRLGIEGHSVRNSGESVNTHRVRLHGSTWPAAAKRTARAALGQT